MQLSAQRHVVPECSAPAIGTSLSHATKLAKKAGVDPSISVDTRSGTLNRVSLHCHMLAENQVELFLPFALQKDTCSSWKVPRSCLLREVQF